MLVCGHVFCRPCLEDYWKLFIKEGDVARVGCPDPACVKQGRESHEEEVRRVVSEDEASRWRWLREKRVLDQGETSAENLAFVLFCLHSHHKSSGTGIHFPVIEIQFIIAKEAGVPGVCAMFLRADAAL